ncbi:MAG: acyltransferase [Pseudomonadota bacterium]
MNFITKFRVEHTGGQRLQQIRSIQALRALAAFAVLMAHLYGVENKHSDGNTVLSASALVGVSGVDLFFVISGFIMVWIAGDLPAGARNAGKFLFARVARIYPVWWLFAGAMAAYLYITYGTPWDADMVQRLGVNGIGHLLKSFLLIPHDALPVLSVGWTLIHEIYFYLVFALLLLLPQSYRLPAFILWAIVILASISVQLTGSYANSIFSLVLFPMTLEFLMGGAAAWILKSSQGQWRWPALIGGVVWLIMALILVDFQSADETLPTARTFAYGPAFALLVYALVAIEQTTRFGTLIPQSLVRIGDWSYSLYLCHLLVISAVARVFFPFFAAEGIFDNLAFIIIATGAALFVSGLAYYLFERPVLVAARRARNHWFSEHDPAPHPVSPKS